MRFKRSDLPGILIALLAPVGLTALFLTAFDVWHHEGTPLLGFMASNIAIGGGIAAAFSRFIRSWDVPVALFAILIGLVLGVLWIQQAGEDGTTIATLLKWGAMVDFLLLNIVVLGQVVSNGVLPILDRRDARRRATAQGGE
ncbi:MAG: hypothetical protein O3B31_12695 [Chloroflexi bacterium]|nr:hypothetical protein [Chloroflexota bacterium]MDA1004183.1 hypothetical protein [Chloroflexota bacterium]